MADGIGGIYYCFIAKIITANTLYYSLGNIACSCQHNQLTKYCGIGKRTYLRIRVISQPFYHSFFINVSCA